MRPDCKGIFAKEPLTKDERLAIFGGHVMRVLDEPEFLDGTSDLALQIDEQFVIGTAHENELEDTDYFNHSCNPNAGFKGQIFLVAMSLVAAGAEVFRKCRGGGQPYGFECCCGSPECRGRVTDNDWKLPELQQRYNGYFSWFLQEKIDRLKS